MVFLVEKHRWNWVITTAGGHPRCRLASGFCKLNKLANRSLGTWELEW